MKFNNADQLWKVIATALPDGGIIGISGYGGSGKTELGKSMGRDKPGVQLIHIDDYLDWPKVCERDADGVGVDFQSIVSAHIKPFRDLKKPVDYLVIEGIYLYTEYRQKFFDFKVWVDTSLEKANLNGQSRDKQNQILWNDIWVPNEIAFEKKHNPKQYADALYTWLA